MRLVRQIRNMQQEAISNAIEQMENLFPHDLDMCQEMNNLIAAPQIQCFIQQEKQTPSNAHGMEERAWLLYEKLFQRAILTGFCVVPDKEIEKWIKCGEGNAKKYLHLLKQKRLISCRSRRRGSAYFRFIFVRELRNSIEHRNTILEQFVNLLIPEYRRKIVAITEVIFSKGRKPAKNGENSSFLIKSRRVENALADFLNPCNACRFRRVGENPNRPFGSPCNQCICSTSAGNLMGHIYILSLYISNLNGETKTNRIRILSGKNFAQKNLPVKVATSKAEVAREKEKLQRKQLLPFAEKLSTIVRSKRNIKHTPSQIIGWTKPIHTLVYKTLEGAEDQNIDRLRRALDWYERHAEEQFVPVIQSGTSLLEKFDRLEQAMERGRTISKNRLSPKHTDNWEKEIEQDPSIKVISSHRYRDLSNEEKKKMGIHIHKSK